MLKNKCMDNIDYRGLHSALVVSATVLQLQDPWFASQPGPGIFLYGVYMFCLCMRGFSTGCLASSQSPKIC